MEEMKLSREGEVFVLTLTNGDAGNTFGESTFDAYLKIIEELEAYEGNAALVVTSDHDKHWCNGISMDIVKNRGLAWIRSSGFLQGMEELFMRVAKLNMPTVAAINGNCYAGGAILASAFDFRFMRSDRGRFCFSEIDVKIAFSDRMQQVIQLLPNGQALNRLALTGVAVNGEQAKQMQVADEVYAVDELLAKAMEYAAFLATKDRSTYAAIKQGLRQSLYC